MASPRTVTIVALSVALGLFFVFMGTIKLTPRLSRDAYNEMVRPAEGRPRGSRVGTATASERRWEGGREPSAGYGGGGNRARRCWHPPALPAVRGEEDGMAPLLCKDGGRRGGGCGVWGGTAGPASPGQCPAQDCARCCGCFTAGIMALSVPTSPGSRGINSHP